MNLANIPCFNYQTSLHPLMAADEVVVYGGEHQQRRNRCQVLSRVSVTEHYKLGSSIHRAIRFLAQLIKAFPQAFCAVVSAI